MKLRERFSGQELTVVLSAEESKVHGMPMLRTEDGLTLSVAAALSTYEVIDATPEEREALQQAGFFFGGKQ